MLHTKVLKFRKNEAHIHKMREMQRKIMETKTITKTRQMDDRHIHWQQIGLTLPRKDWQHSCYHTKKKLEKPQMQMNTHTLTPSHKLGQNLISWRGGVEWGRNWREWRLDRYFLRTVPGILLLRRPPPCPYWEGCLSLWPGRRQTENAPDAAIYSVKEHIQTQSMQNSIKS